MSWGLATALAALRVGGETSPAFQAAAHLFVGGAFTAGWKGWSWETLLSKYFAQGVALTVVETACFFLLPR